jgi:hypothetical protein
MARVYVSSTFEDLKEFREEVLTTLRRLDHIDAAMEHYVAQDERPLDKCLADVRQSDIYIGLFAWRYGYVPPGQTESITVLEYRTAKAEGKTCLIFLLDDDAPWPRSRMELAATETIEKLRKELDESQVTNKFTDKSDLARKVGEAIYGWQAEQGLATEAGAASWTEYKAAALAAHRLLKLQVIAGASRDSFTEIPVTAVFVPQMASRELPTYEVPEHILLERRQLFYTDGGGTGLLTEEDVEQEALDPRGMDADAALRRRRPDPTADETLGTDETEAAALAGSFPEPTTQVLGRERAQVFLGGPGSGKSTLLLYALLLLCDPVMDAALRLPQIAPEAVPFLVDLRQYVLKDSSDFISYIAEDGNDYGIPIEPEHVRMLLGEQGRAAVLFDGLDEIFDPGKRDRVIRQFKAFARQHPTATIVVTSRIVGYDPQDLGLAQFEHYVLNDFTLAQIQEFVPRWYEHYTWEGDEKEARDLVQKIAMSPRLTELSGNPLLLTMMAVLYKREDLPEQRWKLYESCTKVLLEDWDIKRKKIGLRELFPLDILIGKDQKAEILQRVAMYMLEHGEGGREVNAISHRPLVGIFSKYLIERYQKSPGEADALANEILNHLAERTYVVAQIGEGIFGFVHRTFMEYFAACQLKEDFGIRKGDYEWLKQEVFGARWAESEWQEVLLLLAGMLAGIRFPITEVAEYLRREHAQPVPFNVAFAARCLGEAGLVDNPEAARELLTELVAAIAEQAARNRSTESDAFLTAGLAAFSALVPRVGLPDQAAVLIERLDSEGKGRERIVAWQLALTGLSRDEQRSFALEALTDRSEVVRRAAIAALERDWPGNAEVGDAFIALVGRGGSMRVRQAAIEALQRSWPKDARLLDAIEETADRETAYTYVVWLIGRLAQQWSGHPKALPLIMRLVGARDVAYLDYQQIVVLRAATAAIIAGWRGDPTALAILEEWADPRMAPSRRLAAITALGAGWQGDAEVGARLRGWAQSGPDARIRRAAIELLVLGWYGDPDMLPLLLKRAKADPEPNIRGSTLLALTWSSDAWAYPLYPFDYPMRLGWNEDAADAFDSPWRSDPRVLELLEARAVEDESALVRTAALQALAGMEGHEEKRLARLLERSERDDSADVRRAALQLVSHGWASDKRVQKLVERLTAHEDLDVRASAIAVVGSAWISETWATRLLREHATSDSKASVRVTALRGLAASGRLNESELRDLVLERFRQDASSEARAAAAVILVGRWPKDPKTLAFVLEAARHDRHPKVRLACVTMLSGEVWESADRTIYLEGIYAAKEAGWPLLPEVVEALREVASEDPAPPVRRAAIDGLVRALWTEEELSSILTELHENEKDPELREDLTYYTKQAAGRGTSAATT